MMAEEAIPNGWTTEGYCKVGGWTSKFFKIEAILGIASRIMVIYLTKFMKENPWIYSIFSFVHKFQSLNYVDSINI